jgi:hypothetical protein
MSLLIKYTAECECEGTMSSTTLDLSQDPGEKVEINLDMVGDMVLQCDSCGDRAYVPDLGDLIENVD